MQRRRSFGLRVTLAMIVLAALGGCASGAESPTVVRVGEANIRSATVNHWSRVVAGGTIGLPGEVSGTPRQRALAFLISSEWLLGEAAARGVTPSDHSIDAALDERREANGATEFERGLRASGQTVDDVRREVEATLAAAAIRRKVISQAPAVTEQEVLGFYQTKPKLFRNAEKRRAELVENLSSPAAATALVRRIGTGPEFAKKALHEELTREEGVHQEPDIERVSRAIFRARPGVASRPMSLNGHWTVFVVRQITPASPKPLATVRAAIVAHLTSLHHQEALKAFKSAYVQRWTARTSCRTGYVIQGCAQYAGPVHPRPDPLAGE